MSYIDRFLGDTVSFCKVNVVLPPASCNPDPSSNQQSGKFKMKLIKTDWLTRALKGQRVDFTGLAYRIETPNNFNKDSPDFEMYFCYYSDDKFHQTFLGTGADLFFTPKMNGCSFVRGSSSNEGLLVGHANVSMKAHTEEGAFEQETLTNVQIIESFKDSHHTILGRSAYTPLGSGNNATTFGVRGQNGWSFYVQTWKIFNQGAYNLLSLTPF